MLTDVRVVEAETRFSHERARTPIKFGGVVMDSAVLAEARVTVENRRGQRVHARCRRATGNDPSASARRSAPPDPSTPTIAPVKASR